MKAPDFLRRAYRLFRSLSHQRASKTLPENLVVDCRFTSSRLALLDLLPKNGVVCEVGTLKGDFAREILKRCDPKELHLIDIDFSHFVESGLVAENIFCHEGHSVVQLNQFADETFDWIYIDADHSYDAVIADARMSAPKVRPGGYVVFNDFAQIDKELGRYGVHRAVVEFALEKQWPFSFFAYNNKALYDVALRKPAHAD